MKASGDAEYTDYVRARLSWLRRVAFLLSQDWSGADDLVQATITRLYTHWGRARNAENIDAYTRTILVRTFLAERRSSWARRVLLPGRLPEQADSAAAPDSDSDCDSAFDVRAALAGLPPRQRVTLVLRFYCDLPVHETAQVLGCTTGTVKSQTAKGLSSLRRALAPVPTEEP